MTADLPYAIIFLAGALLLPLLPKAWRPPVFVLVPAAALALLAAGAVTPEIRWTYAGYELLVQRVDGLAAPFAVVFTLMLLIGGIYAYHLPDTAERTAAMLYGGAAIGAVLAGDWITLYFFWEIMAWSSLYLVWARRTPEAGRAGQRYIIVHLISGNLLLGGIWLLVSQTGSPAVDALSGAGTAAWLILIGFGINAAVPPLHAWLADAYPAATITGSVFLSAFTTKTAVYALARVFPGWDLLIAAGIIMAIYGVVFAMMENDMRRLLSYHIISQVGYMVAAVGLGSQLAINGAAAHAFAHVLYKSLLFMGVGTVIYATGRNKLTELGGLASRMPLALGLYMVAAVSISGFPLFSGFVSKSMVVAAYGAAAVPLCALALQFVSVGTFLSTGLKLPYSAWMAAPAEPVPDDELRPVPANMYWGMGAGAALCLLIGLLPGLFYKILPFQPVTYQAYSAAHLSETLQLLLFTAFAFLLHLKHLGGKPTITLDTDWIYRLGVPVLVRRLVIPLTALEARLDRAVEGAVDGLAAYAENPPHSGRIVSLQITIASILLALAILLVWLLA